MKKLILLVFLCSLTAFGQGVRFGDQNPLQSTTQIPGISPQVVTVIPGATIQFCSHPANAVPCTNKATTYTDITLGTSCATNKQVVLSGTNQCVATADDSGDWGVNVAAGTYDWTFTYQGNSYGPFVATLASGGGTCDDCATLPGNNAFTGINSFTNAGNFTNTQQNDTTVSNVNGLNIGTEFTNQQGGNFATESLVGALNVPNSSSVYQGNGIAGYCVDGSTSNRCVAVYSQARAAATNALVWGENSLVSDSPGFPSTNLVANEIDVNALQSGSVGLGLSLAGIINTGASATGFNFAKPGGTNGFWANGILFAQGATAAPISQGAAIFFNPVASGTNQVSQGIEFVANDPVSGTNSASLNLRANGNLLAQISNLAAFFEVPRLLVTGTSNFSGILDASAAGQWKAPTAAGYAPLANGEFGYDSTNNNWHFWVNGADHLMVPLAAGFVSGDCGQPTNSGGTWFFADTNSPCGSGGSGATLKTNGTNNLDQTVLNFTDTTGASGIAWSNPSGGIESATLAHSSTTVNSQSCALGGTCTIPFQTAGVGNTSQAGVNFITSTTNAMGITITHSNPGTNQEKAEATGTVNATSGGTGQDTHTATGVAQVNGGTWSVSTALANGTTATTQAAADNSTKVATDAFVLQNAISNPMTTAGDMIVATTSGVPARLPVNTTAVPEVPVSVSSGTSLQPAGISVNTQSGTTYPVAATDRASLIITGNASPVAVSLSQAGTSGFASNFPFGICNSGAGTTTVTPTTSIVNIFSLSAYTPSATSLPLSTGQCSFWYSDNTNYDAILFGASSGGANTSLSNLSSVNINTALLAQTGVDLGSTTKPFRNLFLFGSGTYGTTYGEFTSTPTAARTWTVPDASFTFAGTNLAETFSALQTFGTNISIGGVTAAGATGTGNVVFATSPSLTNPNLGTPSAVNLTNATSLPCGALPALTGNVTTSAGSCATTVAAVPAAAVPAVTVTVGTSSPVTVSTTLNSVFYYNQDATAGTAITYNLPTAAAGKQFCFANSNNGSAPDTGVLTIATSATGQFIIFTDGTLSATGGNVTSGGAAADAACVVGVDSTHWQLYTQVGTWTKH